MNKKTKTKRAIAGGVIGALSLALAFANISPGSDTSYLTSAFLAAETDTSLTTPTAVQNLDTSSDSASDSGSSSDSTSDSTSTSLSTSDSSADSSSTASGSTEDQSETASDYLKDEGEWEDDNTGAEWENDEEKYEEEETANQTSEYHQSATDEQNDENDSEEQKAKILRKIENKLKDLRRLEQQADNHSDLQTLLASLKSKIATIKNCANSATSTAGGTSECWELFEDLNPLFEKAYLAEGSVYLKKELQKLDQIENREIVKLAKNGVDTSELKTIVTKIRNLVQTMIDTTDQDTREDLRWEKEDLFDELWQQMDDAHQTSNFARFDKECSQNVAREVTRAKSKLSRNGDADSAVIAQLDKLVSICHRIVADAKAEIANGDSVDGWKIGDSIREQVWGKLKRLMRSFHKGRMCEDVKRGVKELERGITVEAPHIIEKVPESVRSQLQDLVEKGKDILGKAKAALTNKKCEKAADIMKDAEELHWQFKDIMDSIGYHDDLIDYDDQYAEIYDDFADTDFDVDEDNFKQFMKDKHFGLDEMDRMKKLPKEALAKYIAGTLNRDDRLLQFASDADLDNTKLQALIEAKNELMAEVKALRDQVKTLKQEIQNIATELTDYNFGIGAAQADAKSLASRLATLDEATAADELRELKKKAIAQKVEDGIIGFKDADDTADNWFASFALKTKNKGLIKGNADGTLNPGGNLNYSEAAIAFGRIAGLTGASSSSAAAGNLADWAEQGVAALEAKDVNLDFMAHVSAGDSIKREEVAVLLNEVLGLENVALSDSKFSDLNEASDREKQAIANVNAAGIMTGKGGTDEFGVGENLSRAALTKVLDLATE